MRVILIISFLMMSLAISANDYRFSQADKKVVEKEVSLLPKKVCGKFNSLYEAWNTDWRNNDITKVSSNTNDARKLKDFQVLLNMGKPIIPLIISKMIGDVNDNLIGLILYDDLQDNPALKVDNAYQSEQERLVKTVQLWIDSVKNKK